MPKCAAYFADAPRTAKALGRYTVSTLSCKQVGKGQVVLRKFASQGSF